MPKNISKEKALNIALRHLVADALTKYKRGLKLYDGVPDNLPLYLPSEKDREHCWCICAPQIEDSSILERGRYFEKARGLREKNRLLEQELQGLREELDKKKRQLH